MPVTTDVARGRRSLRLLTYLVPGLPLGLYQTYQEYLEYSLCRPVSLAVESRWSGPPGGRDDPFTTDEADIAFMCATGYLSLLTAVDQSPPRCALLPAAPVHTHPHNIDSQPVYYSDVVVHVRSGLRSFLDLRGCRFGYNDCVSLSGNYITQMELSKRGLDDSFFGQMVATGSHHNSLAAILEGDIDAAAIDANTLQSYLLSHPAARDSLHVLCSWGPMPIQPLVVNSRLPASEQTAIADALLTMHCSDQWSARLAQYHVWGFKPVDHAMYDVPLIRDVMARDRGGVMAASTPTVSTRTVARQKDRSSKGSRLTKSVVSTTRSSPRISASKRSSPWTQRSNKHRAKSVAI